MLTSLLQAYGFKSSWVLPLPSSKHWKGPLISKSPSMEELPGPPWSHRDTGAWAGSASWSNGQKKRQTLNKYGVWKENGDNCMGGQKNIFSFPSKYFLRFRLKASFELWLKTCFLGWQCFTFNAYGKFFSWTGEKNCPIGRAVEFWLRETTVSTRRCMVQESSLTLSFLSLLC